jgi:hypothetical protein
MFKGSLLFIATTVPQMAFLRFLVTPFTDLKIVLGFLVISVICTFLTLSIIVRYLINVRRAEIEE